MRSVINEYSSRGSTVNLCSIDLSKAFDKMNHHGLFVKLMQRYIPVNLLLVIENWFSLSVTCVRWGSILSNFFALNCGIRQGGVCSAYFFAIFIDSIVDKIRKERSLGCYVKNVCVSVLLYADDIIIIAPSVTALQRLFSTCEKELEQIDMQINTKKSACMRIGPHFKSECACIVTSDGRELNWMDSVRYLGVFLISANVFTCSYSNAKKSFYRAFNAIFGKIGRGASEEVVLELVRTKCLPAMLYGLDACPVNSIQLSSLQFAVTAALMKIFATKSKDIVEYCELYFGFLTIDNLVRSRKRNFLLKLCNSANTLCCACVSSARKELGMIQQN
jgi:hypothetical protein